MLSYVIRRLGYAVLTFFGITVAVFTLIHVVPGDPISIYIGMAGPRTLSKPALDAIRHEHHLDLPLPEQYLWWLKGVLTFDFGMSMTERQPVTVRIIEKLPNTFLLNLLAFLLAAGIGVPVGLWSATRSGRPT